MTATGASADMAPRAPFPVPPSLAADGITFRRQTDADRPFVTRLYCSLRWHELQRISWTDTQRIAFLTDQSDKQQLHYRTFYGRSELLVVERHGEPIGRLYLDRGHPTDLRIVDIGLLPEWRGRGLGTMLLAAVQEDACRDGKTVSIHVEHENPARRLYRRLGFLEIEMNGPYWRMEWASVGPRADRLDTD